MSVVKAFRAFRFAENLVGSLDDVITPPFDVINGQERAALGERSPYNMAHLLLPEERKGVDRYEGAGRLLDEWISEGVQRQDAGASFYLLEQCFRDLSGQECKRRGFFGVTKVPEEGERVVLGHEKTFPRKIADRLALTKATRANLGAIFVFYRDEKSELSWFLDQMDAREPTATFSTIDGVSSRLWRVEDDARVTEFFSAKQLYIADGHHRFATACAYRDFMRDEGGDGSPQPYDYVLMGFVAVEDAGLRVFPAHRILDVPEGFDTRTLVSALEEHFDVRPLPNGNLVEAVDGGQGCTLGMSLKGMGQFVLSLKDVDRTVFLGRDHGASWRDLDVAILHRGILERTIGIPEEAEFIYEPDAEAALSYVERGEKDVVFLLRGTPAEQILACSDSGETMPQKSTYLFPKLPSGAVLHRLE